MWTRRVARSLFLLLPLAMFSVVAKADIDVRVGGVGCTFSTIQQAIDNANPANGITNILIARNQAYTAQAININGKNVRLIGGYADCAQTVRDTTKTVISGAGGALRSVINVTGSTGVVAFYGLVIEGGDESLEFSVGDQDNYGGAVDVSGGPHALVYFENTQLRSSTAGRGGALSIRGDSGNINATHVWLSYGTLINGNTALTEGGGIYCTDARLSYKAGTASIFNNLVGSTSVPGNGGGIYANDCTVRVAASGQLFAGEAIANNYAFGSGGGIYAFGSGTRVDIYNVDPNNPTRIRDNTAERNGGGLNVEQGAKVYAWDVIIERNRAYQGGGAVALYDDGQNDRSLFYLIQDLDSPLLSSVASPPNGDPVTLDRAYQCTEFWNCSVLQDNVARGAGDVNQPGSVFRISSDGDGSSLAAVLGGRMTRNTGQSAVRAISFNGSTSQSFFQANGALIDGNTNSTVLIDNGGNTLTQITASTIASNVIPATSILNADLRCRGSDNIGTDYFVFQGNIVDQPSRAITSSTPETGCLRYVLGSVFSNIAIQDESTFAVGSPLFTNAAGGDYTLRAGSRALDFAPSSSFRFTRDGGAREVDLTFNSNDFGAVDLGAYEMQASDFPQANLVGSVSSAPTQVIPGAPYGWQLLVVNNGPSDSPSTRIVAALSATQSCTWTCNNFSTAATCSAASGSGNINRLDDLPAGSLVAYDYTCTSTGAASNASVNLTVTSESAADPEISDNSATATAPIVQGTDLRLTMSDGVGSVTPGGPVTYTITVDNLSSVDSGNVVVTDSFPTELACSWSCASNATGSCGATGDGNIADVANLPAANGANPAGQVIYVATCTVSAMATGSIVNTATVTPNASVTDPNPANNSVTDTNGVSTPTANLALNFANFVDSVAAGSQVDYRLFVTNVGPDDVDDARVRVDFPDTLTCTWACRAELGASCAQPSGIGGIDETVSLPGDATAFVHYDATCSLASTASGILTVTATTATPPGVVESDPSDNSATEVDPIISADAVFSDGFEGFEVRAPRTLAAE